MDEMIRIQPECLDYVFAPDLKKRADQGSEKSLHGSAEFTHKGLVDTFSRLDVCKIRH